MKDKVSRQKSKIMYQIKKFAALNHEKLYTPRVMIALNKIPNPRLRKRLMLKVLDENNVSETMKHINETFGIKLMENKIKEKLLDKSTFTKTYTALSVTNNMLPLDFFKTENTQQAIRNILQPALPLDQDSIKIFLKGVRSSTLNAELQDKNPHLPETFEYGVKLYEDVTGVQKELLNIYSNNCSFDLTRLEEAIHKQSKFDLPHNEPKKISLKYENHCLTFISKVSSDMRYLGAMLNHINNTSPECIGKIYTTEEKLCSQKYSETKTPGCDDKQAFKVAYQYHISRQIIMNDGLFLSDEISQPNPPIYHTRKLNTPPNAANNYKSNFFSDELFIDVRPLEEECLNNRTQIRKYEKMPTQNTPRSLYQLLQEIVQLKTTLFNNWMTIWRFP